MACCEDAGRHSRPASLLSDGNAECLLVCTSIAGRSLLVCFRICASSKRENYPEQDPLSGHTISFIPPLTLLNLLPVDAEFICGGYRCPVQAGQREQIVAVNLDEELRFTVSADRFQTIRPSAILRYGVIGLQRRTDSCAQLVIRPKSVADFCPVRMAYAVVSQYPTLSTTG